LIPVHLGRKGRKDEPFVAAELRLLARDAVAEHRREKPPALRVVEWFQTLEIAVIHIEAVQSHAILLLPCCELSCAARFGGPCAFCILSLPFAPPQDI